MKKLLIVIDCLRYDHSDAFIFEGFQKLTKVISVSNWTLPTITTLLTGLHPFEHKACMLPDENGEVAFVRAIESDRKKNAEDELLTEKYDSLIYYELPVYPVIKDFKGGSGGRHVKADKFEGIKVLKEMAEDDKEFNLLHLKGGHSSFDYTGEQEITPETYKKEINALAEKLNKTVDGVKDSFDRIAIVADHGRFWREFGEEHTTWAHGEDFGIANLHVPVWLYPDENIPDELYDSRVAYQFLEEIEPISRQLVFSGSPAYGKYNKLAISYLEKGLPVTDRYTTKGEYDLFA